MEGVNILATITNDTVHWSVDDLYTLKLKENEDE